MKRENIRKIILEAGFQLSHGKLHPYGLVLNPIVITGVGLEYGGRTFLPRHFLREIRQMIHKAMLGEADPAKVYGMMGAFYSTTGKRSLNWTETKLVIQYNQFRRFMKKEKILKLKEKRLNKHQ